MTAGWACCKEAGYEAGLYNPESPQSPAYLGAIFAGCWWRREWQGGAIKIDY